MAQASEKRSNRGLDVSDSPWPVWRSAAIIVIAALAAYHNTFSSPFIFDDRFSIAENPTIRHFSKLGDVLSPPLEAGGVTGRPVVNFTFALNYALGGLNVGGYHAFNLGCHILAALTLFGVVRRTLAQTRQILTQPPAHRAYGPEGLRPGGRTEGGGPRIAAHAAEGTEVGGQGGPNQDFAASREPAALWGGPCAPRAASSIGPHPEPGPERGRAAERTAHLSNLPRDGAHGPPSKPAARDQFALAVAVIWAVHPLLTESVTYVVQRNEVLVGWFYLLTLYAFIRFAERGSTFAKPSTFAEPTADRTADRTADKEAGRSVWAVVSVLACLFGMASKEVMVSAPLMILLYDRTFVAGSFREAWRKRWRLHAGLASTWLLLGWLMLRSHQRGGTVGFGLGVSGWDYLLTQCQAIVLYLRLSFWPNPLVIDYGNDVVKSLATVAPQAALLVLLAGGTALALWRRPALSFVEGPFDKAQGRPFDGAPTAKHVLPQTGRNAGVAASASEWIWRHAQFDWSTRWRSQLRQRRCFLAAQGRPVLGFLGAWFFLILAPSSSVVPLTTQTIAEHRMYLPLIAVIVLALAGLRRSISIHSTAENAKIAENRQPVAVCRPPSAVCPPASLRSLRSLRLIPVAVLAVLLGAMTILRNADYRSVRAIWEDTLAKRPNNARAHYNLGVEFQQRPGGRSEAIAHFEQALRLKPDYAGAHDALAVLLAQLPEKRAEALAHYEAALRLKPDYAEAHNNLAVALAKLPARQDEALAHYETALRLNPKFAEAHANFAELLARIPGRLPEALAHFEEALRLNPSFAAAHYNLANALATLPGRVPEAIAHYQEALRLAPDYADAHYNLGVALAAIPGRLPEAIAHYEAAVRLEPSNASMRNNLAVAYANSGRIQEAISQLKTAIEVDPTHRAARDNLEKLLGR